MITGVNLGSHWYRPNPNEPTYTIIAMLGGKRVTEQELKAWGPAGPTKFLHGLAVEVGDEVFWGGEPHYADLLQLRRYGFKGILFGVGGKYHRGLHRYLMEAKRGGFWVALASRPQFIERHFQAGYGNVIDAIFVDEADAITPNWKDPKF